LLKNVSFLRGGELTDTESHSLYTVSNSLLQALPEARCAFYATQF